MGGLLAGKISSCVHYNVVLLENHNGYVHNV